MLQQSLDKWCYHKDEYQNKHLKQVFYLNWEQEQYPEIEWLDNFPDKYNYTKNIRWKIDHDYSLSIFGNIPETDIKIKQYDGNKFNISFLKSHLQKCIRRCLVQNSINTAYSLIMLDFGEFIRRLPIIMVEDCILQPEYPVLIWLMASGYKIKYQYQLDWILNIVSNMSSCKFRDSLTYNSMILTDNLKQINNMRPSYQSLLYCLQLRKAFGGMRGDLLYQEYLIYNWFYRLNEEENNQYYKSLIDHVNNHCTNISYKPLKIEDILLESIDFHCFPNLLPRINKQFPSISKDEIKRLIWINESSISFKKLIDANKTEIENSLMNNSDKLKTWFSVKPLLDKIRLSIIERDIIIN